MALLCRFWFPVHKIVVSDIFGMKKTLFLCKIEGLTHNNGNRNLSKAHFINATIEDSLFYAGVSANKVIQKKFVECFERAIRGRGESVDGALLALRARGFILHKSTLNRWKRGILPGFNSLQFNILAQYAGYPSFIEMVTEQD